LELLKVILVTGGVEFEKGLGKAFGKELGREPFHLLEKELY
jgi:hypothetical protein